MTKQEIANIIQEADFQKIIHESDFYFLKGQQILKYWIELNVTDQLKEDLIRLSSDYRKFLKIAESNPEFERIKDILFEIIAYCDNRARDKSRYNQYDDDRVLADASVRMTSWVEGLVKFKFKHAEITGKSIVNALNYLLTPQDNLTILSENHRKLVSVNLLKKEYSPNEFTKDIKTFFGNFQLNVKNNNNYTYLLSTLLYKFRSEWLEVENGLKPSDVTGWQDITPQLTMAKNSIAALNQILFGPPGTGKTYNTVNEALRLTGVDISNLTRTQLKEEFDKKIKEGQIVFTTFHQSMSYEEFIEGIKPIEPEKDGDEVIYRVEPGLFKRLSIEASFDIAKFRKSKETAEALDFSNLYDLFIEEVEEKLINEEEVVLSTKSGGTVLIDSISQQGNIIIKHHNGTRTYTVSKTRLTKLQAAIDSLDSVSNINDEFREVIGGSNSSAYWSVLNAIKQIPKRDSGKVEEKTYTYNDKVEVVKKMTKEDFSNVKGKNYVLIIDEINRGNVSQIFGELITLIEEDKRLGKDEALEVTLPYSKEKFGVPPNLYIIGTMNTADRSVEALDTALRRRFRFTEMPPRYDLDGLNYQYAGEKGSEILKKINKRIEKLLDRDHLIGHSYFLLNKEEKQNPESKLIDSFYCSIIPLLQEYFFGDYSKIGAVLGKGFVCTDHESERVDFATGYTDEDFAEKGIYQIIDYRLNQSGNQYMQSSMSFEKAIRLLMNQNIEQEFED